jgi:hypothetical protein
MRLLRPDDAVSEAVQRPHAQEGASAWELPSIATYCRALPRIAAYYRGHTLTIVDVLALIGRLPQPYKFSFHLFNL